MVRILARSCENVHLRSRARTRSYVPTPRGTYIRSTLSWVPLHEGCHPRTFRFFMLRPILYSPDVVSFLFFSPSPPPRPAPSSFFPTSMLSVVSHSPVSLSLYPSSVKPLAFPFLRARSGTSERSIPPTEIFYGCPRTRAQPRCSRGTTQPRVSLRPSRLVPPR